MEGSGEGCGFFLFSEVTLFEYNVSTSLSQIVRLEPKNDISQL